MDFRENLKPNLNDDTIQTVVKQGNVQNRYSRLQRKWKFDISKSTVISIENKN